MHACETGQGARACEIVLCKHVTELCMHACEKEPVERERERRGRLCKVMSENCVVLLHVRVKRESAFCACM